MPVLQLIGLKVFIISRLVWFSKKGNPVPIMIKLAILDNMKTRLCCLALSLLPALEGVYGQQDLINGREYNRYNIFFTRGIPYFKTDSLTIGSIEFDGKKYDNVPLLYDQVMDEIVTNNLDKSNFVRLVKPRVQRFSVMGSSFINLNRVDNKIPDGYYEILYEGSIKLYKKDKKEITNDVRLGVGVQKVIKSTINYYLNKNGKYAGVRSVSSLITVIDDKKEELKQFAKKNRKRYRDSDMDIALAEITAYYDQLIRQ